MEANLRLRVLGQDNALKAVSNAVRLARAGLHAHTKPLGTVLFVGPSGVGKTELAKALAEFLFDDETAMVRVDMSEYMERHSVSRLIGAPPGYIGYEEGGTLTEAVRRRPYQIVLLDEIEKAQVHVTNVLLQVFDEGHLTDSHGRKVDFRNTILIMTSNLGARAAAEMHSIDAAEAVALEAVRAHFPPEFINRIDELVTFRGLGWDDMLPIMRNQINGVQSLLDDKSLTMEVDDDACLWLAEKGFDPTYGARPLKRALQAHLLNPLSAIILKGELLDGSALHVRLGDDELLFDITAGSNESSEVIPEVD
jgi:ATP-dependent Clp protease ATP-binding subunit ClpB